MDVERTENAEQSIDIGKRLIEVRKNLGLSYQEIANQLNLAPSIIDNIEKNNFKQDIPIAFVRGYIKSYASKIGLEPAPLLKSFDQQAGIESPSLKRVKSISAFDKKRKEVNSSHYLFKTASILIVLALLYFVGGELWKRIDFSADNISEEIRLVPAMDTNFNAGTDAGTEAADTDIISNPHSEMINLNDDKRFPVESAADSALTDEQSLTSLPNKNLALALTNLVLDFSADCWVKITDSRGEIMAEGIKKSGKHMPVEGTPPFVVILGDPSAVTMRYAGKKIDLSNYPSGRRAVINLE